MNVHRGKRNLKIRGWWRRRQKNINKTKLKEGGEHLINNQIQLPFD
jgi:hypothetical protein